MIANNARASVKIRLDIDSSDTTWDSAIDEFVLSGINRLYPIAEREVPRAEVGIVVDSYGEAVVDLSSISVLSARRVEAYSGGAWFPATDNFHHGTSLIVRDLSSSVTKLRIYGMTAYDLATLPVHFDQAVLWFALSEFYDFLAGNKRKYNLYSASGARAVDNMKDEADFYERKANVYLNDRVKLHGLA